MWLVATLLLLALLMPAAALTGHAVLSLSPAFRTPRWAPWFAPVLGLAIWIHLTALLGWTLGFPHPAALTAFALVVALSGWRLLDRNLLRRAWFLAPATAAGTFPLSACMARFGAFNPLNDTYTYLVHARWLQTHAFHQPVAIDYLHPSLSQVYLYQTGQHRMGASFLLAWIQSLTGRDWPHDVYPAVIALALTCGGLTIAGTVALATNAPRRYLLLSSLLSGLTLSGITFGAVHGFLPQTIGLALGLAALALVATPMSRAATAKDRTTTGALPSALCLSAQIYTYPESVPFTLAALCLLLIHRLLRRRILLSLFTAALLAAPEAPRLAHSLLYQATALAGVNSPFTTHEALEHATGFNAGPWQDRMSLLFQPHLNLLVCLLVLAAAVWGLRKARHPAPLLACAALAATLLLAWTWFRFAETNPWDHTTGNPWHQARAATYAAYPALALVAAGLAARPRPAAGILAIWLSVGAIQNYRLAAPRLSTLHLELDCTTHCWQQLKNLQTTAPAGSIALQGFDQEHRKLRRYLTYVLMDHPLAADWSDDDYIGPNLPENTKGAPAPTDWLLTPERPLHFQRNPAEDRATPPSPPK